MSTFYAVRKHKAYLITPLSLHGRESTAKKNKKLPLWICSLDKMSTGKAMISKTTGKNLDLTSTRDRVVPLNHPALRVFFRKQQNFAQALHNNWANIIAFKLIRYVGRTACQIRGSGRIIRRVRTSFSVMRATDDRHVT